MNYGIINEEELTYKGFWRKWNENENFPERAGRKLKCFFTFETKENEPIMIKFGISAVSTNNALLNLKTEIPSWSFEAMQVCFLLV